MCFADPDSLRPGAAASNKPLRPTSRCVQQAAASNKLREGGLEPPRGFPHQILNLARLPIPPHSQTSSPTPSDLAMTPSKAGNPRSQGRQTRRPHRPLTPRRRMMTFSHSHVTCLPREPESGMGILPILFGTASAYLIVRQEPCRTLLASCPCRIRRKSRPGRPCHFREVHTDTFLRCR